MNIFTHHPCVSHAWFLLCWWCHNRLLMMSQSQDNCDSIKWIVISNLIDIGLIHGDNNSWSCKKNNCYSLILFYYSFETKNCCCVILATIKLISMELKMKKKIIIAIKQNLAPGLTLGYTKMHHAVSSCQWMIVRFHLYLTSWQFPKSHPCLCGTPVATNADKTNEKAGYI